MTTSAAAALRLPSELTHRQARSINYRIASAKFPVLSANIVTDAASPINGLFKPSIIKEIGGQRVGIFGLTTDETAVLSSPGPGVTFTNYIEAAKQAVANLKAQGKDSFKLPWTVTEITFKGKSISDVLNMTVAEALEFFENVPAIRNKLQTLFDVGLGYIKLGQPATQLSGGEAQRVKLASELSRRATGRTLYILDEPTTGLHFADIEKLLLILQRLVDGGNTVIVIEHNLDVIKTADWIIDMGPEGGSGGGMVVAEGTPEMVAANPHSFTGEFLRPVLELPAMAAD